MAIDAFGRLSDGGFVFVNLVDFDTEYGHRRDVPGYASALEAFDLRLPDIEAVLTPGDMLIVTADHGNDPTWHGTDHTRECVPILITGPDFHARSAGRRSTFADIGATIAKHLGVAKTPFGQDMLEP